MEFNVIITMIYLTMIIMAINYGWYNMFLNRTKEEQKDKVLYKLEPKDI